MTIEHELCIPFIEYVLPNRRKKITYLLAESPSLKKLADEVIKRGGYFEMEVLSTGTVALYAYDGNNKDSVDEGLITIRLHSSGKLIIEPVAEVVRLSATHFGIEEKE